MPAIDPNIFTAIEQNGFVIQPALVDAEQITHLTAALGDLPVDDAARIRRDVPFARRNLLRIPAIRALADGPQLRAVVDPILGPDARVVRGILFDKNPQANWVVPWHQDLSIAVSHKLDLPGFGPWSIKSGVVHVQPPMEVLRRMLTVRLHLDDCDADNGPLRVIPGTHTQIFPAAAQARLIETAEQVTCAVSAGGAILMRPMLLHASSPSCRPGHRRVIHLEYASAELPAGLSWAIA